MKSSSRIVRVSGDLHAESVLPPSCLAVPLAERLKRNGIVKLFPIQAAVTSELVLRPRAALPPADVCIAAPTGSGKTLAYALPILQKLTNSVVRGVKALVVLPTKDLAEQVYEVFFDYAADMGLTTVRLDKENIDWETGCGNGRSDIVVTTVGRLMHHCWRVDGHSLKLDKLRYVVFDEADRLAMDDTFDWLPSQSETAGFGRGAENISLAYWNLASQKPSAQRIFVSATLNCAVEQLNNWRLFHPKVFVAGRTANNKTDDTATFPKELSHFFVMVEKEKVKPLTVYELLENNELQWNRFLCFANNRTKTDRLTRLLSIFEEKDGVKPSRVAEFSSSVGRMKQRRKLLKLFNENTIRLLVCSDLMGRGVDLSVDCVINYETPSTLAVYIARGGRAARAGRPGAVVTLLSDEKEKIELESVLANVEGVVLEEVKLKGTFRKKWGDDEYRAALARLKSAVTSTKHRKGKRKRTHAKERIGLKITQLKKQEKGQKKTAK